MRLSPLDIRKQEFSRGFRGYEEEEVRSFLEMVSTQWEEMLDELRRKDEKIRELHGKMEHYEKVEEALQEALQTARDTSREVTESAERKASLVIQEAERRADEIRRDAEIERHEIKRETAKLSTRRTEIVTRLRAFLMSEMELLASYEGDDPVGFIKLMPAEKSRVRQISERANEDQAAAGDMDAEADAGSAKSEQADPEAVPQAEIQASGEAESAADITEPAVEGEAPEPERHVHDWTQPSTSEPEMTPHAPTDHDEPEADLDDDYDVDEGWTTQTIVSGRSEGAAGELDAEHQADEGEGVRSGASSEEIEKIRRILSDLD